MIMHKLKAFLISSTGFGTIVDAKGEMNQTGRTAREIDVGAKCSPQTTFMWRNTLG